MAEAPKEKKVKLPTALKRVLQSKKAYEAHKQMKSRVRTAITTYLDTKTQENLNTIYSLVDKGVKRGIYKPNKASRMKSRLSNLQA